MIIYTFIYTLVKILYLAQMGSLGGVATKWLVLLETGRKGGVDTKQLVFVGNRWPLVELGRKERCSH